jgi:hypothetical protein
MLDRKEKLAGRWFKARMDAWLERLNAEDPPNFTVPEVLRNPRHDCVHRGGVSTSFRMAEVCVLSPEIWVCYCGASGLLIPESFPHRDCDGGVMAAPEGRFGFLYSEGRCRCGIHGRSPLGRIVDAYDRPPMGRVRAWQTTDMAARSPESGKTLSR